MHWWKYVRYAEIWKAEMENLVTRSGYNAICVTDGSTYHVPDWMLKISTIYVELKQMTNIYIDSVLGVMDQHFKL